MTVAEPPAENDKVPPASETTGASFTSATVMVDVTPEELAVPSLTTQVTVRLVLSGSSVLVF